MEQEDHSSIQHNIGIQPDKKEDKAGKENTGKTCDSI